MIQLDQHQFQPGEADENQIARLPVFCRGCCNLNFTLSIVQCQLNETFDSYKDGQNLHGFNGWQGFWGDPRVCGSVTSDQSNSLPLSLAIDVYDDTVNEMNNPRSGKWSLTFDQFIPGRSFR